MDDHDAASRLALALDVPNLDAATRLIDQTRRSIGVYKIGLELFTAVGPAAVQAVANVGAKCFLDLKIHDIPATMARTVTRARDMGVDFLTVHGAAGEEALSLANENAGGTRLLAVTVLTSFDDASLSKIGFRSGATEAAMTLAHVAWRAGLRGFVSSAHECKALRDELGDDAFLVTPGIRPSGVDAGDQKRIMTPASAIAAGSSLLVVGRPIRDSDDPTAAAAALAAEVELALQP
ncbi:MAG: orotidine-5'-phosphate decarboxylase [Polyangiales bacterium]